MRIKLLLSMIILFLSIGFPLVVRAQVQVHGDVIDQATQKSLENANVRNIYTREGMIVKSDGKFSITVKKGELLEFTKVGYQTVRVRIQSEKEPLYYKIVMEKVPIELREVDIHGKPLDFKKDSMRYKESYTVVLKKQRFDEVSMQSMPLAMLSKKNREEWAFQEMYEKLEKEKYIDFVFNEKLVSKITYLQGEALQEFMSLYRPDYNFLRTASDYEYLDYIKSSYYRYKSGQ